MNVSPLPLNAGVTYITVSQEVYVLFGFCLFSLPVCVCDTLACVSVCVEAVCGGPQVDVACLPLLVCTLPYILRQGITLNPLLSFSIVWWVSCLCFLEYGITGRLSCSLNFYVSSGDLHSSLYTSILLAEPFSQYWGSVFFGVDFFQYIKTLKLDSFIFFYGWVFPLLECVCNICTPGVQGGEKMGLYPLEL